MSQRILARMDSEARARALQAPDSFLDKFLLANASFPGVVIRSRYAEDALREATIRGVRQYVLIGAGFDSFALRRPAFSDVLYGRTILHDMKPTCPTCNHRMSPSTGSMFICTGCRELVQFFDVRPVDHSLPWWEKYVVRPTSHQTNAWIQCHGPQKQTPAG
jgi:hypothetical protein